MPHLPRLYRVLAAAVTACLLPVSGVAAAPTKRHPLPPAPPSPKVMHSIEGFAPEQDQSFCRHSVEPGVKAFEQLTLATYKNSHSDGDLRPCGSGVSEHYDGRAWDWGVDHRTASGLADGKSMLKWLFKTDADGNADSNFRRLGLMYVIWNKKIWGTWDKRWEPYSCSGANACHVTHIHFSFGWAGAEKKTSFWTGKVSPVLPPDRPVFTGRGHRSVTVAATSGSASPSWRLKGGVTYAVTATGAWRQSRSRRGHRDARCTQSKTGWALSRTGVVTLALDHPGKTPPRWSPLTNTGGGCNTETHAYRLKVTPSATSGFAIHLPGRHHGNDSGAVKLTFTRAG